MIDLETASAQEVFDYVVSHLRRQGRKAIRPGYKNHRCAYKADDGCKCAAGCLIPEDKYTPIMEGKTWRTIVNQCGLSASHIDLISHLQWVHDFSLPKKWEPGFLDVASKFNLTYTPLETP